MAQMSLEQWINCNYITPALAQAALVRFLSSKLSPRFPFALPDLPPALDSDHLRSMLPPRALRRPLVIHVPNPR
jgi:hypothetical protein